MPRWPIMSTPWCRRPPLRGAPHVSANGRPRRPVGQTQPGPAVVVAATAEEAAVAAATGLATAGIGQRGRVAHRPGRRRRSHRRFVGDRRHRWGRLLRSGTVGTVATVGVGASAVACDRVTLAPGLLGDQRRAHAPRPAVGRPRHLSVAGPPRRPAPSARARLAPLLLGLVLLVGEPLPLVGEIGVEGVEAVEVVGRRVVDHLEQGVDLDLVLRRLEPGRAAARRYCPTGCSDRWPRSRPPTAGPSRRPPAALISDCSWSCCRVELVDARLRGEVGIGGGVGPLAGVGDLFGRLLGLGVVGAPDRGRPRAAR